MKLVDRWDGTAAPFEGDRTLRLLSLPARAVVRAATVRVEPASAPGAAGPFAERILLGRAGTGGRGATVAAGAGWCEVDFHARRTLANVAGSGLGGATLLADFGGGIFVPIDASGAVAAPSPRPVTLTGAGERFDLPGLTASRIRIANPGLQPRVREVGVRSVPANVALRLGDATFWTHPGELASPDTSSDFAPLLQAWLDAHPAPEGRYAEVPLTVHADGIARLLLTFEADLFLRAPLLPPGLTDATLPFDYGTVSAAGAAGGPVGPRGTLTLPLVAGARVVPGGDPPRVRGVFQDTRLVPGRGMTGAVEMGDTARARVSGGFSQAQQVPPGAAAAITGVDLFLGFPTGVSAARLQLDLRADHDGAPDPRSLLARPVPFTAAPGTDAARPVWVGVALPAEVHLQRCQGCWIVLQALEGEVEWMGIRGDSPSAAALALDGGTRCVGVAGLPPLRSTSDAGLSWRDGGPMLALFRLRCRPAAFRVPLEIELGDPPNARRVPLSRFDALGRVDFAIDTPELAAALEEAAGAAPPGGAPHEALANGDFREFSADGSAPGTPAQVENVAAAAVAAGPDGRTAYALAFDREAVVAEVDVAGDEVKDRPTLDWEGPRPRLLVHPDGRRAFLLRLGGPAGAGLSSSAPPPRLRAFDLATFAELGSADLPNFPADATLSADGETLFLALGQTVAAVPTAALEQAAGDDVEDLDGFVGREMGTDALTALTASADGTRLYAGGNLDVGGPQLFVLDPATLADAAAPIPLAHRPARVALTPDGATAVVVPAAGAASAGGSTLASPTSPPSPPPVALVDLARGGVVHRDAGRVADVALSPDGRTAYLLANAAAGWGIATLDLARRTVAAPADTVPGTGVEMAVTPRGDRLYVATLGSTGENSQPQLWAVPLGNRIPARWTVTPPLQLVLDTPGKSVWAVLGDAEDRFEGTASLSQVAAVAPATAYTFRFSGLAIGGAEAEVFWLDAAGALLRREGAVDLPQLEGDPDTLPPALPVLVLAYTSPATAAQAEVRFRVPDGGAAVAGVSLAATASALAHPGFERLPGADGSGWAISPAVRPGAALRSAGGVLSLANRGQAAVELSQSLALADTRAMLLHVDGGVDLLAGAAEPPAVAVTWLAEDGAVVGRAFAAQLLAGDFETRAYRLEPPAGAVRAEVRLAVPAGAAVRLREVSLRAAPEAAIPLRFIAEAPGELSITGTGLVLDVAAPAALRAPAAGLVRPSRSDRVPGTGDKDDPCCGCAGDAAPATAVRVVRAVDAVAVQPAARQASAFRRSRAVTTLQLTERETPAIVETAPLRAEVQLLADPAGAGVASPSAAGAVREREAAIPESAAREAAPAALQPGMIRGIAAPRITRLASAGITTLDGLADASAEEVRRALAVGADTAEQFIAEAKRHLPAP